MASRVRYDKCVAQIKADLLETHGRTLSGTRIDQMLTVASDWFLSIHPDWWPFATVATTSVYGLTHSVVIQDENGNLGPLFWTGASPSEAGDASTQLSGWTFSGYSLSNTDALKLYWNLSNSGTTRTVSAYKDSAKAAANLVAQGTRTGDGIVTLAAQNTSGLSGSVTVAYTIDDTDAANILTFATLPEPKLSALWIVKTQVGASSGSWKPLPYVPWRTMSNRTGYNRTAATITNQKLWSIKNVGSSVADKFNAITLETFPYSYVAATDAAALYYQLDYFRKTPTITAGASADDAFIWDEVAWDYIIIYVAEAMVAHELGILDKRDGAWFLARTLAQSALRTSGVIARRIHLPPPWLARTPTEVIG